MMKKCFYLSVAVCVIVGVCVELFSPIKAPSTVPRHLLSFDSSLIKPLQPVKKLFKGELYAPEHLAVANDGTMLLSLGDGRIVQMLNDSHWQHFTQTGEKGRSDCGQLQAENACGRPLGMKFVEASFFRPKYIQSKTQQFGDQILLVADAYKGLLLVDKTGHIQMLIDGSLSLFNAVDFSAGTDGEGIVYLSDSSNRFKRNQIIYEVLEGAPNGRILAFYPKTGRVRVVLDQLPFPNGIALTDNDQSLLVALTSRNEIVKITLKDKKMTTFTLLPGPVDNIAMEYLESEKKTVLLAGLATKTTSLFVAISKYPKLRKLIGFLIPYNYILSFFKPFGILVSIDANSGEVLRIYEDPKGDTPFIAGGHIIGQSMYLTSWKNPFLGKINVSALNL